MAWLKIKRFPSRTTYFDRYRRAHGLLAGAGYDSNVHGEAVEWNAHGRRTGRRFLCAMQDRGQSQQPATKRRETHVRRAHRLLREDRRTYFRTPRAQQLYARPQHQRRAFQRMVQAPVRHPRNRLALRPGQQPHPNPCRHFSPINYCSVTTAKKANTTVKCNGSSTPSEFPDGLNKFVWASRERIKAIKRHPAQSAIDPRILFALGFARHLAGSWQSARRDVGRRWFCKEGRP